ncbi:hypothetical protein M427DRAFT_136984 [Gonapodya prolifera JEL478]|uniref:RING-type E3 ubiquitin transferase n=1 Tax=Gonapodya prolifera (strain JEL478) TaxID=1344416 RepID=A0A139A811_GONPJ|nr:hypothetical protein M427DRAFT_136984 [Gonapodya prolifera JEL478]|eukprot:KXS12844.1 hypothetical protein M427DRAFT_136984 [Gonapodya prolifera JEL478]
MASQAGRRLPPTSTSALWIVALACWATLVCANIVVPSTNDTYVDREAAFGSDIPEDGIQGRLLPASLFHPDGATDGCQPLPFAIAPIPDDEAPSLTLQTSTSGLLNAISKRLWSDEPKRSSSYSHTKRDQPPLWERRILSLLGVPQQKVDPVPVRASSAGEPVLRPPPDFIALVERGECPFIDKVRAMQQSGAIAVIVGDNGPSGNLVTMYAPGDTSDVFIPSVFVAQWEYRDLRYLASVSAEKWIREVLDGGDFGGAGWKVGEGGTTGPNADVNTSEDPSRHHSANPTLIPPGLPIILLPSTPSIPLLSVLITVVLAPLLVLGVLSGYYVMRRERQRTNDVLTRREVEALGWRVYKGHANADEGHTSNVETLSALEESARSDTGTLQVAVKGDAELDGGTGPATESGEPIGESSNSESTPLVDPSTSISPHPIIRPCRPPSPASPTASTSSSEDLCAICLDSFQPGDRIRPLPCGHDFHAACVDEWLIERRRVCPVCKRDAGMGKRRRWLPSWERTSPDEDRVVDASSGMTFVRWLSSWVGPFWRPTGEALSDVAEAGSEDEETERLIAAEGGQALQEETGSSGNEASADRNLVNPENLAGELVEGGGRGHVSSAGPPEVSDDSS